MPDQTIARGEIYFDPADPGFTNAVVRVQVEDTTDADAASRPVAVLDIPQVSHDPGSTATLPFNVAGPPLPPGRRYSLRVHVDVGNSGSVQGGDFVSTASYPVDGAAAQPVRVAVRRVTP